LAPEVLKGEEYSNKVDIYAFGVILWEMLTRSHFLDKKFAFAISDAIIAGERPPIPEDCLPELKSLIPQCWAPDPNARPSINECIDELVNPVLSHCPDLVPVATADHVITSEKDKSSGSKNISSSSDSNSSLGDELHTIPSIRTLDNECTGSIMSMVYVPFLKQIWCGDGAGSINVYSSDGQLVTTSKCHEKRISSLVVIKPYVWSTSFDSTVKVNSSTLGLVKEFKPLSASTVLKVQEDVWVGTFDMEVQIIKRKVRRD